MSGIHTRHGEVDVETIGHVGYAVLNDRLDPPAVGEDIHRDKNAWVARLAGARGERHRGWVVSERIAHREKDDKGYPHGDCHAEMAR
jgi:hypothetical protein